MQSSFFLWLDNTYAICVLQASHANILLTSYYARPCNLYNKSSFFIFWLIPWHLMHERVNRESFFEDSPLTSINQFFSIVSAREFFISWHVCKLVSWLRHMQCSAICAPNFHKQKQKEWRFTHYGKSFHNFSFFQTSNESGTCYPWCFLDKYITHNCWNLIRW